MDSEEDQTKIVKEAEEYANKKMAAYHSAGWLDKIKFRYNYGQYFKNPILKVLFALFGRVRGS